MQIAVDHERLSLKAHLQVRLLDVDGELLGCGTCGDDNVDRDLPKRLLPRVFVGRTAISSVRELPFRLFIVAVTVGLVLFLLFLLFRSRVSLCRVNVSRHTRISLAGGLLSFDQGSLLCSDLGRLSIVVIHRG